MIRNFEKDDIDIVMNIWLDTNIKAHSFIAESYWKDNFEAVKTMLPEAEIYAYEEYNEIKGFIGLNDNYIQGIFVTENSQSKGIGKQLLDYVKTLKNELSLKVYKNNMRAIQFYEREGFEIKAEDIDEATGQKEFCMNWNK